MTDALACQQCGAPLPSPMPDRCPACGAATLERDTGAGGTPRTVTFTTARAVTDDGETESVVRRCPACGATETDPQATVCGHCHAPLPTLLAEVLDHQGHPDAAGGAPPVTAAAAGADLERMLDQAAAAGVPAGFRAAAAAALERAAAQIAEGCPACGGHSVKIAVKPGKRGGILRRPGPPTVWFVCLACGHSHRVD